MAGFLSRLGHREKAKICAAVVVAAGSATRMEGIDKILTTLGDVPVLVHTLRVFQRCPEISEVVVVTREDLLLDVSQVCKAFALDKVTKVVVGGSQRALSVLAGLRETRQDADLIAIHDGARPLVTDEILQETVARAAVTGAAAPAIPVTDTIKRVEEGFAVDTVDRSTLFAVQTPQIFQADLIRAAVQQSVEENLTLTDECAAVERLGMKVAMTRGSRENIKITTPFDLLLGEAILDSRMGGEGI